MRNRFVGMVMFGMASLLYGAVPEPKERAETAVVLLNHLNWIVSRVEQNQDNPVVVEEEYENLTDNNINLATIEDEEIAHEIVALMRTFTGIRECIMDVDALNGTIELQRKAAIYKAMPNPGVVVSPNPYLIAIRLAESAATSYMNYQNAKIELQLKSIEKKLEIDKRKLNVLNAINEELFWRQWQIVQKHGLNDYWRTARSDCRELVAMLSVTGDDAPSMVYSYLKRNQDRFSYLPIYWYYRMEFATTLAGGLIAEDNELHHDVLFCAKEFEKRQKNILRKDRISASVAMMSIGAEGKNIAPKELENNLETIKRNMKTSDWDLAYFIAEEYVSIGKQEMAVDVLRGVVNDLEAFYRKYQMSERTFDISSMRELQPYDHRDGKAPEKRYASFPSHGLFLCRILLVSVLSSSSPEEGKRMAEALLQDAGQKNVSLVEKLVCCQLLGMEPPRNVLETLRGVAIHESESGFRIGSLQPFMIGLKEKIPATIKVQDIKGREFDYSPALRQHNKAGNHYDEDSGDIVCNTNQMKMKEMKTVSATLHLGGDGDEIVLVFRAPFSKVKHPDAVWFRKKQLF